MSQSMDATGLLEGRPAPTPERVPVLSSVGIVFIVMAVTVSSLPGWNVVTQAVGFALAAAYLIHTIRAGIMPTAEVLVFAAWLLWCLVGFPATLGPLGEFFFWETWGTCFQMMALLAIISGFTINRRTLSFNLGALLLGAGIVGGYSLLTGEYALAAERRVEGLALNANAFGWIMFLATACMAYLWMQPSRALRLKRVLLAVCMTAASAASLMTGSRKTVLGFVAFYGLWLWLCYRKTLIRKPAALIGAVLVLALAASLAMALGGTTVVGRRLGATWDLMQGTRTTDSGEERLLLYREAWDAFVQSPIVGVGLNNARVYTSSRNPVHSEYAELAADTGIVGFILYFSMYVILWRRVGKIIKHAADPEIVRNAKFIRAFLVIVLLLNLGRWNFDSKAFWIIFGSLAGYSNVVWKSLRPQAGAPAAHAPPGLEEAPGVRGLPISA
ncbi:MAG: O-antigen ligase family protein [Planctomycetota bacterium]|nr:O-antigen ligase family protein [Planctomycetota bacterium]